MFDEPQPLEPSPGRMNQAPLVLLYLNVLVVATCGLAVLVAPLSTTIEAVDRDLTLYGLRLAARHVGLAW